MVANQALISGAGYTVGPPGVALDGARSRSRLSCMARQRPRSEVAVAVGIVAFIAIAFLKPWGSPSTSADTRPHATATATPPPSIAGRPPSTVPEAFGTLATSISLPMPPLEPVGFRSDIWFPADGGHVIRVDTGTSTAADIGLDPTRFSGKVGLAGDPVTLWVTGADDHSVGILDTVRLEVSLIPAITTEPMVIDKINGAAGDGGSLWFIADVHASQDILGTPCCNGFTAAMLYRADGLGGAMTQVRQLDRPIAIRAGSGLVWILSQPTGSDGLLSLDSIFEGSDTVLGTVVLPAPSPDASPCGACISSFLVGSNSLWVPTGRGNSLIRVDPTARRIAATIDLGRDVESVVEAPDGYVWVAGGRAPGGAACDPTAGYISVIDPSTNRIVRDGSIACPVSFTIVDGQVWVGTDGPDGPSLHQIRPPD